MLSEIFGPNNSSIVYWGGNYRISGKDDDNTLPFKEPMVIDILNSEYSELFRTWNLNNEDKSHLYPVSWFDKNHTWCFVDANTWFEFLILGCTYEIANQLKKTKLIEIIEVNYNDNYL